MYNFNSGTIAAAFSQMIKNAFVDVIVSYFPAQDWSASALDRTSLKIHLDLVVPAAQSTPIACTIWYGLICTKLHMISQTASAYNQHKTISIGLHQVINLFNLPH